MAYAALVSLAQTIDQILKHDRYPLFFFHGKQLMRSIHEYTTYFQAFLEDFPEKANSLEEGIRDVAYEAEDIVEYFMSEQIAQSGLIESVIRPSRTKRTKLGCKLTKVAKEIDSIDNLVKLTKVTMKIDSVAAKVMDIKNSFIIKGVGGVSDFSAASSSSRLAPTHKDVMVGFDDDLAEIKSRLCGLSSKLQVIPIFGMGGIDKTTLARNAYDDPLIMEYFHIHAWVAVSQDYSMQEILSGLLASVEESNKERSRQNSQSVEEKVYKSLKGRRYLIVMDDMWSTEAWDDVRNIFPDDDYGSRIMITTRLLDVAAYPDPCSPLYEMRLMDADQSWNLLRQKVFAHQDCPPELENIGKEIATSCRGLPLAIVVIAGLLSRVSKTPASWGVIAENVNSAVATKDAHFEKIISLSYTHLPHHLRPCFLYLGGFPEDHEIHVSELIKLWIAEGFLKYANGSKSMEEEAEEYLEDLVKRSLIFVTKMKSNGKIKSCSVHDLVRDLCIRKAQEEKFLLHAEKVLPKGIKNQRRISATHFDTDCLAKFGSEVRTIKLFQCQEMARDSLGNFRLVRALDVVFAVFRKPTDDSITFPDQVCEPFHLRYLAFMYYIKIPTAISNLQNLQTLIIYAWKTLRDYPCAPMASLPMGIWRMPQLRHLVSSFFDLLPNFCGATFPLHNLQTLSQATNFICSKRVLEMIPNLKKLGIFYYRGKCDGDYHLEDLVYLHQLEKLKIKIYADFPLRQKLNPAFPRTLKKLTLSGWRVSWERMTIVGSLPNLELLKLKDFACKGNTWETNEGEFPELNFLLIDKSDLQHWITESSHFPRLKSLVLHRCWCLIEIPDGIGEIPTLELIEVDNGNKSLVELAKRIQEEQQSWGNEGLQFRWAHS